MRGGSGIVCFYSMSAQDCGLTYDNDAGGLQAAGRQITHQDRQLNLPPTKMRLPLDDAKF
jgi:hypothetical protein